MKKLIAILLALLLMCSVALPVFAFPSTDEGDGRDETYGIAKGYVRTKESQKSTEGYSNVITRTYNKQGKLTKEVQKSKSDDYSGTSITKNTYDKKGNLTKSVYYENDYVITDTFAYNSKGNVTKETRKIAYEDNSTWTLIRTYTYNKAGKVTKELAYYDDCEDIKTCTYDKKGNLTKEVRTQSYEDNTQTKNTITYAYDKNGNETKMSIVDKDRYGSVEKHSYVCVYNEKNLCVKMTEKWSFEDNEGNIEKSSAVSTYTYDKAGNLTKEVFKSTYGDGSKRTLTFVNTYDETGNKVKAVTTEKSDGYNAKTTATYTYTAGLLTKEATVTKDGDGTFKVTETYAYDKAGNLTKYVCAYKYADGTANKEVTVYTYQKIGA